MKATIGLEWIGEGAEATTRAVDGWLRGLGLLPPGTRFGTGHSRKPWVSELVGWSGRWERRFVNGKYDCAKANSKNSRGVALWFVLESGRVYEVRRHISWTHEERYFCAVSDEGDLVRMTRGEVEQWAKERWGSMFSQPRASG